MFRINQTKIYSRVTTNNNKGVYYEKNIGEFNQGFHW